MPKKTSKNKNKKEDLLFNSDDEDKYDLNLNSKSNKEKLEEEKEEVISSNENKIKKKEKKFEKVGLEEEEIIEKEKNSKNKKNVNFDILSRDTSNNSKEDDDLEESKEEDLSISKKKKKKSKKKTPNFTQEEEENNSENGEEELSIKNLKIPSLTAPSTTSTAANSSSFSKKSQNLAVTGTLLSHERSKDIQIDKFTVSAYGQLLVSDTSLNLIHGRRYGLVGENGCGKSTLLRALASGEVLIQKSVNLYLLEREFDPTDLTAVDAVVDIVKQERDLLEEEMIELLGSVEGATSARLEFIQERLEELDLGSATSKAKTVLHGLGFSETMMDMKTKDFSGGWRMRVSLARALFVKPTCLLLDDATNHLDLSAVVWLEEYLVNYPHTVVLVSHSQDFLNTVCTDIMYLHNKKLDYFTGDYDNFLKVKEEIDDGARKRMKADEKKMKKIKENLGRSGKQAKQAKSQEKAMLKRQEKDAADGEVFDKDLLRNKKDLEFTFGECGGGLPSPFLKFNDVSFHYEGKEDLYKNLNFGLDLSSRVALVGPNGAGKSTLMKLMTGELEPTAGTINRHHHLRIAWFHQHLTEQLNLEMSAVEWLCLKFPGTKPQEMRGVVGNFGLTGKSQVIPMEQLSDGQRRRVLFCWLSKSNAHLLMLDEPTNFLDPETLDALADAIREFDGGVVLISHDFRLIDQVAEEIWVVDGGEVEEWEGDIREYKEFLRKKVVL